MEIWGEQIIIIFIFLLVPLFVGIGLPYCLLKNSLRTGELPVWFSPINSVSTGLLLGVLLLHLIPDANGDTAEALEDFGATTNYPVSMLLVGIGFFIVTLVELLVERCNEKGHGHSHDSTEIFEDRQSPSAIYTMIFGLSAHSVFEGLAIGLQGDSSKLWTLAAVVLIHKSLFALVMGLAALRSLPKLSQAFICLGIFSISSPIGIAIGTMVFAFSTESATMDLAVGLLESISTGTFLFVVFVELMPKELDLRSRNAFSKLALIILGFLIMSGFQALGALEDAH